MPNILKITSLHLLLPTHLIYEYANTVNLQSHYMPGFHITLVEVAYWNWFPN